jgi:hypothetical protein
MFVIARNTAFTYKGKSIDAKQVGRELGVRYLLEGSVRRASARELPTLAGGALGSVTRICFDRALRKQFSGWRRHGAPIHGSLGSMRRSQQLIPASGDPQMW